jgi:hypothetical protein
MMTMDPCTFSPTITTGRRLDAMSRHFFRTMINISLFRRPSLPQAARMEQRWPFCHGLTRLKQGKAQYRIDRRWMLEGNKQRQDD